MMMAMSPPASLENGLESFLAEAIRLGRDTMRAGEGGPFGALIVRKGEVLARGWNQVTSRNDPTAHAEMVAIREACRRVGDFRLAGCTLYVSCEPCPMCLAACYWAGIERIVYAADRQDAARIGFADAVIYEEVRLPPPARKIVMEQAGREAALAVFTEWEGMAEKVLY
ncbi:MAG: nucleoside deaminase [Desulfobacteraceae bacterium]|nr:nucleoside deaminase [Desulfobacteraceae bacterium]